MKHLKISNQCHENWNDFKATKQGAFCQKCKIDVKDFSNMSNHEIKFFLETNNSKHLCGKFRINQIDDFNNDTFLWTKNNKQTIQSKFIFALLITFGLTLFSCSNELEIKQIKMIAKMINLPIKKKKEDAKKTYKKECVDKLEKHQESIKSNVINYEIPTIDKDSTFCGGTINDDKIEIDKVVTDFYSMGMILYQEDIEIKDQTIKDTSEIKIKENKPSLHFNSNIFPNPACEQSNLIIDVRQDDFYVISLMDLNGRILDKIYNEKLFVGEHQFNINLNDYGNGYYLIYIQTKNYQESLKVLKVD
jgi:hypothetical protein